MSLYPISSAIGQESQESHDVSLEKAPLCDAETYAAGEYSLADDTSADDSAVARLPLYASLFPGAGAWNQAVALFGGVAASLATLLPPKKAPPAELFDHEKLNERWTLHALPRHLTVLMEAFERHMGSDQRFAGFFGSLRITLKEGREINYDAYVASLSNWLYRLHGLALESGDGTAIFLSRLMLLRFESGVLSMLDARGEWGMHLSTSKVQEKVVKLYAQMAYPSDPPYSHWIAERLAVTLRPFHFERRALVMDSIDTLSRQLGSGWPYRLPFLQTLHSAQAGDGAEYWRLLTRSRSSSPAALTAALEEIEEVVGRLKDQGRVVEAEAWRGAIDRELAEALKDPERRAFLRNVNHVVAYPAVDRALARARSAALGQAAAKAPAGTKQAPAVRAPLPAQRVNEVRPNPRPAHIVEALTRPTPLLGLLSEVLEQRPENRGSRDLGLPQDVGPAIELSLQEALFRYPDFLTRPLAEQMVMLEIDPGPFLDRLEAVSKLTPLTPARIAVELMRSCVPRQIARLMDDRTITTLTTAMAEEEKRAGRERGEAERKEETRRLDDIGRKGK